jgi:SAM-dependent methyltransferase
MKDKPTIEDVRAFWQKNPLFVGESQYRLGSVEFFDEHRNVYINDCFAGSIDRRIFPKDLDARILDAGCGIGMWSAEFILRGYRNITAVDLTNNSVFLTAKRIRGLKSYTGQTVLQANIESLPFPDNYFSHINCQGVIHHTPNPEKAISELFRVLKPGGTALISVYHRGILLKIWDFFGGKLVHIPFVSKIGLNGRGRESLVSEKDSKELVRKYDGLDNPIGVAYSKREFKLLLRPFQINTTYLHFFPLRAFPFNLPNSIHKLLDRTFGLLIFANLEKQRFPRDQANDSISGER